MGQLGGNLGGYKKAKGRADILEPGSLLACELADHASLVLAPSEDLYFLIRELTVLLETTE